MIISKHKRNGGALVTLRDSIGDVLRTSAVKEFSVSTEGFSNDAYTSAFDDDLEKTRESLRVAFSTANAKTTGEVGEVTISDEALNAAAIVSMACSSDKAYRTYANMALDPTVVSTKGVTVIEPSSNPSLGYSVEAHTPSFEAFDARALEELRSTNVMFAFNAAIQDEFGEAFFRTTTLSPDGTGLEVSIRRTVVMQEVRHPETGNVIDFRQRNLLDALTEPSLLINEATRIYPRVIVGDAESEKHFVDAAIIAPYETIGANGAIITTAPIRVNERINLLGAGANERTPGTPDQTDAIDHAVTVTTAFFRVKTAAGESIIKVNTKAFAQNGFQKSFEGNNRRIALDFPMNAIFLNKDTLDVNTQEPAEALAFLGTAPYEDVTLQFETRMSGEGNLTYGWLDVNGSKARIKSARKVNGPSDYDVIRDEATLAALGEQFLEFELVGYEVKAYYANTNKRFLGLLIDSLEERYRYIVPLLPPISVQTPITGTATQTDLSGPMNAQRMTNSLNAVTKILEVRDLLREVVPHIDYGDDSTEVAAIEGFARTMIRPYLFDEKINLADVVQSLTSGDRVTNISAALVNLIRYGNATMYTESRYQPALDAFNGTAGSRPTLVLGTDPRIASYLIVNGDPRLVGLGIECKVVVSYDYRMRNQIVGSYVRPNVSEVDVMSFGAFAYMPELLTTAQYPVNQSNTTVTQVQNRNLHVVFLPLMMWIEVEGLEAAAAKDLPFSTRVQ